jgi:aminocarboxymuconate-semialdehyde decarboxylase
VIVDCHAHAIPAAMRTTAVPDDWRPRLEHADGQQVVSFQGQRLTSVTGEFCDVAVMLEQAAAARVSHLVLSPWIALVPVLAEPADAARICRAQNESLAQAAADHAGRVYALGAVPLQDPVRSVSELEYLMGLPGLRGVEVPASVAGCYVGEQRFERFWAAAADTGAVVFVHPTTRGLGVPALAGHYLWNAVGNPIETTIAAAQLVLSRVLDRHPALTVLLAHGGGALPVLRGRLRRAVQVRAEARADFAGDAADVDAAIRRLYFDSLTHDRAVLADLVAFAGAGHVLLGSDRPFDMGSDHPADDICSLALDPAAERQLLGGNADRLLKITTHE